MPFDPPKFVSSWTWIRWIRGCISCSLGVPSSFRSILLHMFWTSPFNASLNFFDLVLVIGLLGTSNGPLLWLSLVLGWSSSFPFSSKGFNLESSLTSNRVKSETLKVTLTPYSLVNQLYKHCHWSSQGSEMTHLLVAVAWISYGLEISHCTYAPKPNRRAERQHVFCALYWL
jgi:hypothetical protein